MFNIVPITELDVERLDAVLRSLDQYGGTYAKTARRHVDTMQATLATIPTTTRKRARLATLRELRGALRTLGGRLGSLGFPRHRITISSHKNWQGVIEPPSTARDDSPSVLVNVYRNGAGAKASTSRPPETSSRCFKRSRTQSPRSRGRSC